LSFSAISRASWPQAVQNTPVILIGRQPSIVPQAKSLQMMQYQEFLDCAGKLQFVEDPDAAVKAVYGIVASRFEEADARQFTSKLPEPLAIERLRGHQASPSAISVEDAATTLVQQFHISREQAHELLRSLTSFAREVVGREVFEKAAKNLPRDWTELLTI
jgi:uncharacterized protein (DUF2267 family)